jgi:hypothetical protein
MADDEYRRRAALALSILNNADGLGTELALSEARLALEGASITDLAGLRSVYTREVA